MEDGHHGPDGKMVEGRVVEDHVWILLEGMKCALEIEDLGRLKQDDALSVIEFGGIPKVRKHTEQLD